MDFHPWELNCLKNFCKNKKNVRLWFLTEMNVEEFVAHSGNVNCLRFGKKTCRSFVTGGDDQTVNLWSIGKATSTAVSSSFDRFICSGLSDCETRMYERTWEEC